MDTDADTRAKWAKPIDLPVLPIYIRKLDIDQAKHKASINK